MKDAHVFSHYKEAVIGAVVDLAAEHPEVVFLDADLSSCIGSTTFQKAYPDRFFNCGIAEANMAGVAAGLASTGLVPFIHSFGCFASRRDSSIRSAASLPAVITISSSFPLDIPIRLFMSSGPTLVSPHSTMAERTCHLRTLP